MQQFRAASPTATHFSPATSAHHMFGRRVKPIYEGQLGIEALLFFVGALTLGIAASA